MTYLFFLPLDCTTFSIYEICASFSMIFPAASVFILFREVEKSKKLKMKRILIHRTPTSHALCKREFAFDRDGEIEPPISISVSIFRQKSRKRDCRRVKCIHLRLVSCLHLESRALCLLLQNAFAFSLNRISTYRWSRMLITHMRNSYAAICWN